MLHSSSATAGYALIPKLNIVSSVEGLKELPPILFKVQIPPAISVMGALVLAYLWDLLLYGLTLKELKNY